MEEKKRLWRLCRSCGVLGFRSDNRTDRMGIDGSFCRIRYTVIPYLVVGNA